MWQGEWESAAKAMSEHETFCSQRLHAPKSFGATATA